MTSMVEVTSYISAPGMDGPWKSECSMTNLAQVTLLANPSPRAEYVIARALKRHLLA